MVHELLRNVAFMCIMIMLGTANLINAPFTSKVWICVLEFATAAFAYFMAWTCYRKAKLIAKAIDSVWVSYFTQTLALLSLLNNLCKEDSGAEPQQQAETTHDEENADNYAHPV